LVQQRRHCSERGHRCSQRLQRRGYTAAGTAASAVRGAPAQQLRGLGEVVHQQLRSVRFAGAAVAHHDEELGAVRCVGSHPKGRTPQTGGPGLGVRVRRRHESTVGICESSTGAGINATATASSCQEHSFGRCSADALPQIFTGTRARAKPAATTTTAATTVASEQRAPAFGVRFVGAQPCLHVGEYFGVVQDGRGAKQIVSVPAPTRRIALHFVENFRDGDTIERRTVSFNV